MKVVFYMMGLYDSVIVYINFIFVLPGIIEKAFIGGLHVDGAAVGLI